VAQANPLGPKVQYNTIQCSFNKAWQNASHTSYMWAAGNLVLMLHSSDELDECAVAVSWCSWAGMLFPQIIITIQKLVSPVAVSGVQKALKYVCCWGSIPHPGGKRCKLSQLDWRGLLLRGGKEGAPFALKSLPLHQWWWQHRKRCCDYYYYHHHYYWPKASLIIDLQRQTKLTGWT